MSLFDCPNCRNLISAKAEECPRCGHPVDSIVLPPDRIDVEEGSLLSPILTNSIGIELVLIPAGQFWMGSPDDEEGHEANEGPRHEVEITRPFYLGKYPVTRTLLADPHHEAGQRAT